LACLQTHPLSEKAISLSRKFIQDVSPKNRLCTVSKTIITDPDSYIYTGLLISDEREPIYKFNFITLNKNNFKEWEYKDDFIRELQKFTSEHKLENVWPYSNFLKLND